MIDPITTTTVVSGDINAPDRNDIDETMSTNLSAKGKHIGNNQQLRQIENNALEKTLLVRQVFSSQNSNNVTDLNVIQKTINKLKSDVTGSINDSLAGFNRIQISRKNRENQSGSQEKNKNDLEETREFEQIVESYIKLLLVKIQIVLGENAKGMPLRVFTFYQLELATRIVFKQYFSLFSYETGFAQQVSSEVLRIDDCGKLTEESQPVTLVSSGESYTKDWLSIEKVSPSFHDSVLELLVINKSLKMKGYVLDCDAPENGNLPALERVMYMPGFFNSW